MKIVKRALKMRIRCLVNMNKTQLGFMPGRGTANALLILCRTQEEDKRCACVS